jgi:hypothetical protein
MCMLSTIICNMIYYEVKIIATFWCSNLRCESKSYNVKTNGYLRSAKLLTI